MNDTTVSDQSLNYPAMIEDAMRGVVRQALAEVAAHGMPPRNHFYITFNTRAPGVGLSDRILAQHPDEITIVLQHQFWGLEVQDDSFAVNLSFGGVEERVVVPFTALIAFTDPGVQFGLRFGAIGESAPADAGAAAEDISEPAGDDAAGPPTAGQVIALDRFRNK